MQDPNLVLTGPTRSVVLSGTNFIEVDLKVKGTSEDKTLFSRVVQLTSLEPPYSRLLQKTDVGKFSTLEFTLGHIIFSLEATISVRVIGGSWPDGFHGKFAAYTTSVDRKGDVIAGTKSVHGKEIVLLVFGPEKAPVTGDGKIELSRCVVCVEDNGKLEVAVKAWQGDNIIAGTASFTVKESGRSCINLVIASCQMEVTVAWSLISSTPELRKDTILKNNCCSS